jgi:hypothetical protein
VWDESEKRKQARELAVSTDSHAWFTEEGRDKEFSAFGPTFFKSTKLSAIMRGTLHKFISMLLSTTVNNYCLT